jgi:hypothetical protein
VKTFKPLIKDMERSQLYGASFADRSPEKRSDSIKLYKRKFIKTVVASLALLFVSLLFARCYFMDSADDFIDKEYDHRGNSSSSFTFSHIGQA